MKLRNIFLALFSLIILYSCSKEESVNTENPDTENTNDKYFTFEYDNLTRKYRFYKPDNLPANAPLVFVLHGYTQNADWSYNLGFNEIADTAGFAICYPQGSQDNNGITHWNARLSISNVNDIGFLSELARFLQSKHDLDTNRTFTCGFSNGGFMSYTLACEAHDVFMAIAPVSGVMSGYTWENREEAEPVPVLHIHGTDDETVPIDGSMSTAGGWGGAPKVDSIISYWTTFNNCTTTDTADISANTKAYYHRNEPGKNEVWYYKINNYGHQWPGEYEDNSGINANKLIWKFFRQY